MDDASIKIGGRVCEQCTNISARRFKQLAGGDGRIERCVRNGDLGSHGSQLCGIVRLCKLPNVEPASASLFCKARDETSRLLNIYERLGRFGLLGGLEAAAP